MDSYVKIIIYYRDCGESLGNGIAYRNTCREYFWSFLCKSYIKNFTLIMDFHQYQYQTTQFMTYHKVLKKLSQGMTTTSAQDECRLYGRLFLIQNIGGWLIYRSVYTIYPPEDLCVLYGYEIIHEDCITNSHIETLQI